MKYKISKERKEIIIYGQENLSCKLWGENWGSIHNIIEKWMNKKCKCQPLFYIVR